MANKTWEDFLDNFDAAQPDVKITWGPDRKEHKKIDYKKRQQENQSKLAGNLGIGRKPTAAKKISLKDLERIKKLEALANDDGATEHEKLEARKAIERIRNRG